MNVLRKYLDERGMNATFFARKVGVTRTCIYDLYRGKRIPTLEVAVKIELATDGLIKCQQWLSQKIKSEDKEAQKVEKKRKKNELKLTVSQES
ncbi:MAG: helix-turn-helix transcriptional regulator [Bacillota bacterium]|nr:helix-turn-helix transcriptional regulator [Bacillota bacterium]